MNRADAVNAANDIIALYHSVLEFLDVKIEKNVFVDDDSTASLALSETVWKSVRLIMDAASSLSLRKIIRLDRDRQVIELCAELYQSVDDAIIDAFITENNLSLNELETIPMGREVAYNVKIS
jgi:hypothetical protein